MSRLATRRCNAAISSPFRTSVVQMQRLTSLSKDRRDQSETLLRHGQLRTAVLFKFILEPVALPRRSHYSTEVRLQPDKAQLLGYDSTHRFLRLLAIALSCAILPSKTPLLAAQYSTPMPIQPISALPHTSDY